jgi:hypothetical protein
MTFDKESQRIRYCIHEAGGDWGGLQEAIPPMKPSVIVINPETNNHLAILFSPMIFEDADLIAEIRKRLDEDTIVMANRRISIPVEKLRTLARQLTEIQVEIDALLERKKS